jgi:hypothetical protein
VAKGQVFLLVLAAIGCAFLLCPGVTRPDSLTGSVGTTWL